MIPLLLTLIFFVQGVPLRPAQGGTITGILKTADGQPAAGIRVAARARPDSLRDAVEGTSMAGLAETDPTGHYRLEDVPPGSYYISAGRVDLPTFYPGTLDMVSGRVLTVTPGSESSGIDFTVADVSVVATGMSQTPGLAIPLEIVVDGGKLPVFSPAGFVRLVATNLENGNRTQTLMDASQMLLPFPIVPEQYRVVLENLPRGYTLKSMSFGDRNLLTESMRISAGVVRLSSGAAVDRPGAQSSVALAIELAKTEAPRQSGPHISGRAPNAGSRSIYLSEDPGLLYADGTFEFFDATLGRQSIFTGDGPEGPVPNPLGASVLVGAADIANIELEPVLLLPRPGPSPGTESNVNHEPGSVIPLAGIRGKLTSQATQKPLPGVLNVLGDHTQAAVPIQQDGSFQIPKLLPGTYVLQISVFDHFTVNETVMLGEDDVTLDLRARRAY